MCPESGNSSGTVVGKGQSMDVCPDCTAMSQLGLAAAARAAETVRLAVFPLNLYSLDASQTYKSVPSNLT